MELLNSLFFPLMAGHLVADFWLQPSGWIACKRQNGWKSKKLIVHALIASVLPVLFTLRPACWWLVPLIFGTHYLIDLLKMKVRNSMLSFVADQFLHLAVLFALAGWAGEAEMSEKMVRGWIYACGFILVTNPLGILIGLFLKSVTQAAGNSAKMDASAWIGILERILILIFIAAGQFSAIGFLIAAKSIFRFNETKEGGNLKAEYFLLGTLASFAVAITVGLGINLLVGTK